MTQVTVFLLQVRFVAAAERARSSRSAADATGTPWAGSKPLAGHRAYIHVAEVNKRDAGAAAGNTSALRRLIMALGGKVRKRNPACALQWKPQVGAISDSPSLTPEVVGGTVGGWTLSPMDALPWNSFPLNQIFSV